MQEHNAQATIQKSLGHFRSSSDEQTYKRAYQTAMDTLPQPTRTLNIPTSFGTVRVYEFKNKAAQADDTPIVLLPGRSSGVPMWGLNLPGLFAAKTVYALDALGDAGLSVQARKLASPADQADWIEQVFAKLNLSKIHLIGHSFGGWLATNYAVHFPKRLVSLGLFEPVFVFQGLRWQVYLQATLAILPFLPQQLRDNMLSKIGGGAKVDRNHPIAALVASATSSFITKVPQPTQITTAQLSALDMPVFVAIGGNSAMHNPDAVRQAAQTTLNHPTIKLWPNGTHSLPMEFTDEINAELLRFIAQLETA